MEIKRSGSQPSVKGPADWFTGTVRIDPLVATTSPARVAREASPLNRCRTASAYPPARAIPDRHSRLRSGSTRRRRDRTDQTRRCGLDFAARKTSAWGRADDRDDSSTSRFRRALTARPSTGWSASATTSTAPDARGQSAGPLIGARGSRTEVALLADDRMENEDMEGEPTNARKSFLATSRRILRKSPTRFCSATFGSTPRSRHATAVS